MTFLVRRSDRRTFSQSVSQPATQSSVVSRGSSVPTPAAFAITIGNDSIKLPVPARLGRASPDPVQTRPSPSRCLQLQLCVRATDRPTTPPLPATLTIAAQTIQSNFCAFSVLRICVSAANVACVACHGHAHRSLPQALLISVHIKFYCGRSKSAHSKKKVKTRQKMEN